LADRDVVTGPQLNSSPTTADAGASPSTMNAQAVSVDVGEIAGRVQRAEHQLTGAAGQLRDDLRDDGAGGLAGDRRC